MSAAEDYIDNYDDRCPHGRIICDICAAEEDEFDEDDDDEDF